MKFANLIIEPVNALLANTLSKTTVVDVLRQRADRQPEQVGYTYLVDGETQTASLTYRALDLRARAIAAHLQSLNARGSRALLLYPSGLAFVAAFFGCLYAGVTAVPAYPPQQNQTKRRLQSIAADAQATFALTTSALLAESQTQFAGARGLPQLHWIATDDLTDSAASDWQRPTLDDGAIALLQYTSGSTGVPKGVMISHENLLHNAATIQHCFQDGEDSIGVSWLPPYHDMGLIGGILQPLSIGRPMVLMSPMAFLRKPVRWLQAISRYRATTSGGPNFAYELCVKKISPAELETLDLSSWQVAFNGAEPIRPQTLESFAKTFQPCGFHSAAFYPCYGMAEATLMIAGGTRMKPPEICTVDPVALKDKRVIPVAETLQKVRKVVGCGRARLEHRVAIVDPVSTVPCGASEVGEIWVSSASVARGYWNQPQETERVFKAYLSDTGEGPFLRTGDLGFMRAGELFVTGRLKELIIIRGRNHYPQDIEWTVQSSHCALRAGGGAAFSIEANGAERLAIVQEVERGFLRQLPVAEICAAIRRSVSEQHQLQISAIALLKPGSIPKTSSGKIQRAECRAQFLAGGLDPLASWSESTVDVRQVQAAAEAMLKTLSARSGRSPESSAIELPSQANQAALGVPPMPEAIETWITANLALYLKISPEEIDLSEPFSHYGLDSSIAASLATELSNWLGRELDPTLFWEYPSIEALAQHLGTST
ncbi:AMP-binding protein [Altericista sp. CCNU0014]|uniref:AMP-binding protein n=1 Tax=Altericista sp. CCNU0014 TaxID=3082949 RepID=UPI00384B53D9